MPAGFRYDDDGERVAAYRLPGWEGCYTTDERSLEALNAQRAAYARAAQEEHGLKKTGADPRWHKAEARRYERLERAYRLVMAWLAGETRDLRAHLFPLEMAEELDAAFRHNALLMAGAG
jgi:hypothetical protein